MFHGAFDDLSVTVEDEVVEGEKVANRWTFRGTHTGELMGIAPTDNRVEFSAISVHRIAEGRFAEGWVNFDAMGTRQQLGAIPAPGQAGG
jgi:predicted ester cyclase